MDEFGRDREPRPRSTVLDNLIDKNRTVPLEYQDLIDQQLEIKSRNSEPYSDNFKSLLKENEWMVRNRQWLTERLQGTTLVDLGGGTTVMMPRVARTLGADTYVSVDLRAFTHDLPTDAFSIANENPETRINGLREVFVKDDLLDFISRMHDQSASFTLNGIDGFIIRDLAYHKALAKELIRTLEPGGVVFGIGSDVFELFDEEEAKNPAFPLRRHPMETLSILHAFVRKD